MVFMYVKKQTQKEGFRKVDNIVFLALSTL